MIFRMQQSTIRTSLLLLLIAPLLTMCGEEPDPRTEAEKFISIYDNNQLNAIYFPIDVKQTADGGYIILAAKEIIAPDANSNNPNFYYTYIIRADKNGNFIRENELESNYVSPVGDLVQVDTTFYFFCRDVQTFQAKMITINQQGNLANASDVGVTYPAAASSSESNIILMGYDNVDRKTVLKTLSTAGAQLQSASFDIGPGGDKEVEAAIIDHFTKKGRRLPFL